MPIDQENLYKKNINTCNYKNHYWVINYQNLSRGMIILLAANLTSKKILTLVSSIQLINQENFLVVKRKIHICPSVKIKSGKFVLVYHISTQQRCKFVLVFHVRTHQSWKFVLVYHISTHQRWKSILVFHVSTQQRWKSILFFMLAPIKGWYLSLFIILAPSKGGNSFLFFMIAPSNGDIWPCISY